MMTAASNVKMYELEKIKYPLETAWSVVSHLNAVKNSPQLREGPCVCLRSTYDAPHLFGALN
jgi:Zn-dependent oligopeptidase